MQPCCHHPLQLALVVVFPLPPRHLLMCTHAHKHVLQLALCGGGCMWWCSMHGVWYMYTYTLSVISSTVPASTGLNFSLSAIFLLTSAPQASPTACSTVDQVRGAFPDSGARFSHSSNIREQHDWTWKCSLIWTLFISSGSILQNVPTSRHRAATCGTTCRLSCSNVGQCCSNSLWWSVARVTTATLFNLSYQIDKFSKRIQ